MLRFPKVQFYFIFIKSGVFCHSLFKNVGLFLVFWSLTATGV